MKKSLLYYMLVFVTFFYVSCTHESTVTEKIVLKHNWVIQSSKKVHDDGERISSPGFAPKGWYLTSMPSTVLAAQVKNKEFPDPYYGTNIESIPGYVKGRMDYMPENSPYNTSWWYSTEFNIPDNYKEKHIWLNFHSINYKANLWLNGFLIADTTVIVGAYRLFNLDITKYAITGDTNRLALEIFPPQENDLTITWVDWNPIPPDRATGIWYDVSINATGSVKIQHPHVVSKLNLPSTDVAKLTVTTELKNAGNKKITGTLKGVIENIEFSSEVTLAPGETKMITFSPEKYTQLIVSNPRLWWPNNIGPQNLYDLNFEFKINDKVSDTKKQRFGIREISYYMNEFDGKHSRVFQVNGKNILIRGGGYVEDMMLRPSKKNEAVAVKYAKHMNLNTLRMEAPHGSDYLYDLCDEEGILLMVGWCCCSTWEHWDKWTPHIAHIADESWKDQIIRLRNHPSVFTWLYGSDNYPPEDVERRYIETINKYDGTRPYESSATGDSSTIAGYTGFWMGPYPPVYAYFPPSYWYGKLEFNTECSPGGEQIPPIESLYKMMPEEDIWPISKSWDLRLHKMFYPDARKALYSRYGQPHGVEEYCMKSQVMQQEVTRAMFEAFARNKYRSSGVIYWMYNSAWPSLYWQLYDYYLTPNGAFYGTQKACEPLHIQYSYDDKTIYVVNGYYENYKNLEASAKIFNFDMKEKYSNVVPVNISSDTSKKVMDIDWPEDLTDTHFLKLELKNDSGKVISSNFYWLSVKGDELADFTALNKLPTIDLNVLVSSVSQSDDKSVLSIEIENPSSSLAFAVNPSIRKDQSGHLVTPIYWDDNYFALLPKEKRTVKIKFNSDDLNEEEPVLVVDGWNVKQIKIDIID